MKFTYESPDVEPSKREILADGWYDFEVVNVYDKDREGDPLVSRTGTPYLKLVCEEAKTKTRIFNLLFLAEDNARKISALIHACRMEVEAGDEIDLGAATFMGRSFRGKVETETGKDQVTRNRIARVIRDSPAAEEAQREPMFEEPEGAEEAPEEETQQKDEVPF